VVAFRPPGLHKPVPEASGGIDIQVSNKRGAVRELRAAPAAPKTLYGDAA
jgi:hypothetical protein